MYGVPMITGETSGLHFFAINAPTFSGLEDAEGVSVVTDIHFFWFFDE